MSDALSHEDHGSLSEECKGDSSGMSGASKDQDETPVLRMADVRFSSCTNLPS